jgi:putative ABC transport system permease protein
MVIVVGLAATIGVMLSMLSVAAGMRQAYYASGDPNRAIVVTKGVEQEGQSTIARAQAPLIAVAPGIAKDKDGKPLADRTLMTGVPLLRKDGSKGFTSMRGLSEKGPGVRPELKIVAGRMFQSGKRELIAGVGAQALFQHMQIGDKVICPTANGLLSGFTKPAVSWTASCWGTPKPCSPPCTNPPTPPCWCGWLPRIRSTPSKRR